MAERNDFAAVRRRLYELHAAGDYATALEVARGAARDSSEEADRTTSARCRRDMPSLDPLS